MPIRISRGQKREKERGTDEHSVLLRALNQSWPKGFTLGRHIIDNRMLLTLVKRLQELQRAIDASPQDEYESPEIERGYRAVNRLLKRYVASPKIENDNWRDDGGPHKWRLYWQRIDARRDPNLEIELALKLVQLAQDGRINTLKQCGYCKKWIFAKFSHQRFCGTRCKESFHRSDPADIERRRAYAREIYRLHTKKNVK